MRAIIGAATSFGATHTNSSRTRRFSVSTLWRWLYWTGKHTVTSSARFTRPLCARNRTSVVMPSNLSWLSGEACSLGSFAKWCGPIPDADQQPDEGLVRRELLFLSGPATSRKPARCASGLVRGKVGIDRSAQFD